MAKKSDTALNVLGTAAAVSSFLNLNKKPTADSKIGQFHASLRKNSIARTNRFEVIIGVPDILAGYRGSEQQRLLSLRCETCAVPGISFTTTDVQRYGYGLSEKVPTNVALGEFTCSFIGDQRGDIYKFFYRWMNGIIKWDEKPNNGGKISYNYLAPFEHEYKSRYATPIQLLTYDENDDRLLSYEIYEAFPVGLGEIQYNWGDQDNLVRFPVNFAYSHFKVQAIDEDFVFKPGVDNRLGLMGAIVKAGTAVQTFASLKKPTNVGDIINVVNNAKIVLGNLNL